MIDRRCIDHDATRLLRTISRALEACEAPITLRLPYAEAAADGTGRTHTIDLIVQITPFHHTTEEKP